VWAKRIQTSLQHHGFKELNSDLCIYFKTTAAGLILIAIYVDDLLVAAKNENAAAEIKNTLAQEYMITDLGIVERYLGIEIEQDPNESMTNKLFYTNLPIFNKLSKSHTHASKPQIRPH
jgi:Reverse transcriptase (RNA-dependent DNA polymerase)